MIVGMSGYDAYSQILNWGNPTQVGNWLEQGFNSLWYGQPDVSAIPVSVVGAPQTQEQMTSGSFTPLDAATIGQAQYQQKVSDYFNSVPANAGSAPLVTTTGFLIIGVLIVGGVLLLRR